MTCNKLEGSDRASRFILVGTSNWALTAGRKRFILQKKRKQEKKEEMLKQRKERRKITEKQKTAPFNRKKEHKGGLMQTGGRGPN